VFAGRREGLLDTAEQASSNLREGVWRPSSCSRRARPGKFSFSLVTTNGQVIATSEAYESKASAVNGIESVKRNAADAAIDDQTDN